MTSELSEQAPLFGGTLLIHTDTIQRYLDLILELYDRLYPMTDTDEGGRFSTRRETWRRNRFGKV